MRHGTILRVASVIHQPLDGRDHPALDASWRVERMLREPKGLDRTRVAVQGHGAAKAPEVHVEEELIDHLERLVARDEHLPEGKKVLDRCAALDVEHHLVEVALYLRMHRSPICAVKALHACVADTVLLREDERVNRAIEQVVAEESRRVRLGNRPLCLREHTQRVM